MSKTFTTFVVSNRYRSTGKGVDVLFNSPKVVLYSILIIKGHVILYKKNQVVQVQRLGLKGGGGGCFSLASERRVTCN